MVIRQKGESQNGCLEKTKHAKFSEKRTFLTPDTHTYVRNGGKCSLFGKFDMLCFLETTVLRFALLPYYRRPIFKNICEWLPRGIVVFDAFQRHLERNLENERLYCTTEKLNIFILIHQYSLILFFSRYYLPIVPSTTRLNSSLFCGWTI